MARLPAPRAAPAAGLRHLSDALSIRPAVAADADALWAILEPIAREGETFALPRDLTREAGLAYWLSPSHTVFVAEDGGEVLGSYYIRANQQGGGAHVANAGYMTAPAARGRGIARRMGEHSLQAARAMGYRAIQFNFVVSSNSRAVALWSGLGFETVGRLPGAFAHPTLGLVDALVMYRAL